MEAKCDKVELAVVQISRLQNRKHSQFLFDVSLRWVPKNYPYRRVIFWRRNAIKLSSRLCRSHGFKIVNIHNSCLMLACDGFPKITPIGG